MEPVDVFTKCAPLPSQRRGFTISSGVSAALSMMTLTSAGRAASTTAKMSSDALPQPLLIRPMAATMSISPAPEATLRAPRTPSRDGSSAERKADDRGDRDVVPELLHAQLDPGRIQHTAANRCSFASTHS